MILTLSSVTSLALLSGLGKYFLRHGFWRASHRLPDEVPPLEKWPEVVAVIPARNEAEFIGRAVASLLAQDYPGKLSLVLVDDRSEDGTAAAARAAAALGGSADRLTVLEGAALPPGWTGKTWAMAQGARVAAGLGEAPYLLLTDADISHDAQNLRRLVAKAETEHLDLVSLMVLLRSLSVWERLLIPAFVFFFQMLYPFREVNRRQSRVAAAAGGCMLLRKTALERAGGIAAIRGALIDDLALARLVKRQGGAIWLGLTERVHSIRPYETLGEIWHMVARSAYTQLKYSPLLLLGTVVLMSLIYLVPPPFLVAGLVLQDVPLAATAFLAWALMAYMYRPTLALYGEPAWRSLLLPLAAALYMAMTVDSALRHWRGRGGAWKGRTYAGEPRPSG